jgi:hypothetical protein
MREIFRHDAVSLLASEDATPFPERLQHYLDREDDPRPTEIFDRLNNIVRTH